MELVQWMLAEGGSSIAEATSRGFTALLFAADGGHMELVQWLLAEGGSSIAETASDGQTAWSLLRWPSGEAFHNACGPSNLAKSMLLMGDPPPSQGNHDDDAALLLRSRASSLREALPGWRHRRAEVVCGAGVLPEALMGSWQRTRSPAWRRSGARSWPSFNCTRRHSRSKAMIAC